MAGQERRTIIEAFGKLLHPCWLATCMMYILCLGLLLRAALHLASLLLGHWSSSLWRIRDGVLDWSGGEKSNVVDVFTRREERDKRPSTSKRAMNEQGESE